MTQKTMYNTIIGDYSTVITNQFVAGTDTTMYVEDTSFLPSAPNRCTVKKPGELYLVTIQYTGKTTNTLTGVAVIEGTPSAALSGSFARGCVVSKPLTRDDIKTIQDNIRDLDSSVLKRFSIGGVTLTPDANRGVSLPLGNGLMMDNGKLAMSPSPIDLIYGIKLNWGTSAPGSIVTYSQNSAGFTPATTYNGTTHRETDYKGTWENDLSWIFSNRQRYYCVLHNIASATAEGDLDLVGTENYKLDPTDITKKTNGQSAVIDGSDGDVMVCRRFMYDKYMKGTGNEDELIFSPNNHNGDLGWYARAFEFEGTVRDRVYVGVCIANKDANNRLRSGIGLTPTGNITIGNADTYATNNNPSGTTGYSQYNVNLHDMYQKLFWLKYGNTNSQAALGYGYANTAGTDPQPGACGESFSETSAYGGAKGGYDYGLISSVTNSHGTAGSKVHNRFDGVEDFAGNMAIWCKGVTVQNLNRDGTTHYWVVRSGRNNERPDPSTWNNSYKRYTSTALTANANGYYSAVSRDGENDPIQGISFSGGSDSKYLCDDGYLHSGYVALSGGSWAKATSAGVSRLTVDTSLSNAYAALGARLVYYAPELAGE